MDCCDVTTGSAATGPLLAQVLGIGVVWTTFHCAGMCGPLVASLRLGARGCALRAGAAAGDAFAYQLGRATTLTGLGAAAGAIGSVAMRAIERGSVIVGFILGLGFLACALDRLVAPRRAVALRGPGPVARLAGTVARRWAHRPRFAAYLLGVVLGMMPCMIVAWALSLAAASGRPLAGALVMLCLVALTIPVLTASALAPAFVRGGRRVGRGWVGPASMLFSAAWMLLIASAAAGWIAHRSITIGAQPIMFW